MSLNAYSTYLESTVLSADPLELVRILYGAAIDSVRDARAYQLESDIAGRARALSKAMAIVTELTCSLDHANGAELSENLAALYDYIRRRLTDANIHGSEPAMTEVLGLLSTLAEAWDSVQRDRSAARTAPSPWPHVQEAQAASDRAWSI